MRVRALALIIFLSGVLPADGGQLLVDAGRGPVTVHIPTSYDPAVPAPLVLNLHGYTNSGADQEAFFQLLPLAEDRGFLYAYPQGISDFLGNPFWNATDACCALFGSNVDDSTYLMDLIEAIRDQLSVNPWRIHFTGWSNGGFMSYRMACDHADAVASIGSLAGATFLDPADCAPVEPVHVLQIHGTSDGTIGYGGGSTNIGTYPGAIQTVETWADYNGCSSVPDTSPPPLDLDGGIAGAETDVRRYDDGCKPSGSAELWTIDGGAHGPALTDDFRQGLVDFVLGHPRAGVAFLDEQTLVWSSVRWAASYQVYRGAIADLFDGNGDGLADPGYGLCVSGGDPDPSDTGVPVPDSPAPGAGFFYVVGFTEAGGAASSLGTAGNGLPRGTPATCP